MTTHPKRIRKPAECGRCQKTMVGPTGKKLMVYAENKAIYLCPECMKILPCRGRGSHV